MRAVLQRVSASRVDVDGKTIGSIDSGWLVLLAVMDEDEDEDIDYIVSKTLNLRGFPQGDQSFDLSALDAQKEILVVSQFTLYGDCRKGRRPSFTNSAAPLQAKLLYEKCLSKFRESGLKIEKGKFQAMMDVHIVNDGPVTFILDSRKNF